MAGREENDRIAGEVLVQVIAGRDGKPAFIVVSVEVFFGLLAYARKSGAECAEKATEFPWETLCGWFERESGELFRANWEEALVPIFNLFADISADNDSEAASEVAAYDAAKEANEESFPLAVADRLIVGENPLKVLRQYRGLTQKQLADKTETTAAYLSQIETGRRGGSIKLLHRLADVLEVGLDDLV